MGASNVTSNEWNSPTHAIPIGVVHIYLASMKSTDIMTTWRNT